MDKALKQLTSLFEKRVITEADEIAAYGQTTLSTSRDILAIIFPCDEEEIRQIFAIANQYHITVHAVSTGNNWGYGNANPVKTGSMIIDLSRMNKVIEFDEQLGTVTVQPGVTQGQLYEFLKAKNSKLMVPTTGGGPNCSIMGNALERGFGINPVADHFQAIFSLKAILPDGSSYASSHCSLGASDICKTYKWGLGPYLDGLFSQGAFGIVTELTIALQEKPEIIELLVFSVGNDNFYKLVNAARVILKKVGGSIGNIKLINQLGMLSLNGIPYYDLGDINDEQRAEKIKSLARQNKFSDWTAIFALYGSKDVLKPVKKYIRKELRFIGTGSHSMTEKKLRLLKTITSVVPFMPTTILRQINALEKGFEILSGVPNQYALKQPYWITNRMPDFDKPILPHKDSCGLIWFSPLVPIKPSSVEKILNLTKAICGQYNIEHIVTLTSLNERCFDVVMPILFDKNDEKQTENAAKCVEALITEVQKIGFFPYRLDINSLYNLMKAQDINGYWQLVSKLKAVVDPNYIFSPGHYVPLSLK